MQAGDLLSLDITKPTAGGRMLARHEGLVVLVHGAIPGERVRARIERMGKGVAYADAVDVMEPSPDRRAARGDWRCGGNVLAHVTYQRQLRLKGEIVADAFARIGRLPIPAPSVVPSPEHGYRMRARLHVRGTRIGLFREGSHELCDVAATGQLLPETLAWLAAFERLLEQQRLAGMTWVELAENIPGSERACHFEVAPGESLPRYAALRELAGDEVSDVLHARPGDPAAALRLHRNVRAFFQGNRFLLERLVQHVVALVPGGPVLDLYAGVGLFGLSLCAAGFDDVTLVEGDAVSGSDLLRNAEPFGRRVRVERRSVESYVLRRGGDLRQGTSIVDPPRTGMSKDALRGLLASVPDRIVYVSCDPPTLARDARALTESGYGLAGITGFDLFPNTAHVEAVALFERSRLP